jgi:hypothetical protein
LVKLCRGVKAYERISRNAHPLRGGRWCGYLKAEPGPDFGRRAVVNGKGGTRQSNRRDSAVVIQTLKVQTNLMRGDFAVVTWRSQLMRHLTFEEDNGPERSL